MKENTRPPQNTINESQPLVEWYQVDIEDPQSSCQVHYINEAGTSENLDTVILGNHDHSTTIVNSCFSTIIAERISIDSDLKTNVILTSHRIFPIEFKWVFIWMWNKNNKVVRYKVRLMAQGFTQIPDIDFN
jgi:hypothetical protein